MNFDVNLIKRLLNHGRLTESAYPSGLDGNQPASIGPNAINRQTNSMGDNPMTDPSHELEEQLDTQPCTWCVVARFGDHCPIESFASQREAQNAGYSPVDYAVKYGRLVDDHFVTETPPDAREAKTQETNQLNYCLSPQEVNELMCQLKQMGIDSEVVAINDWSVKSNGDLHIGGNLISPICIQNCVQACRGKSMPGVQACEYMVCGLQQACDAMAERIGDQPRELVEYAIDDATPQAVYTHMVDELGNVMVSHSRSGKQVYLQGQDALELLAQLPDGLSAGRTQYILSQYQHVMENSGEIPPIAHTSMDENCCFTNEFSQVLCDLAAAHQKLTAITTQAAAGGNGVAYFASDEILNQVNAARQEVEKYLKQYP